MAEPIPFPRADETAARALPSNVEAEAAFLGAVLIDNRVIEELPRRSGPRISSSRSTPDL
jgi:replicative DNA helicase